MFFFGAIFQTTVYFCRLHYFNRLPVKTSLHLNSKTKCQIAQILVRRFICIFAVCRKSLFVAFGTARVNPFKPSVP